MQINIDSATYNALLANISKKDVRLYLGGIYVDTENDCLVATDGHALMRVPVKVEGDRKPPFILPATARAPVGGGVCITDTSEKSATVTMTKRSCAVHLSQVVEKIDAKYPDYLKVIPNGPLTEQVGAVVFRPRLIERTVSQLKLDTPAVRLRREVREDDGCANSADAFVVQIQERDDITLIVMPCL